MSEPFHIPLDSVRIAQPCRAEWGNMEGDDTVRFCQTCHKNVYNLSAMSQNEAEALINCTEGTPCVRFYKRADGTVMTGDCPVGANTQRRPFIFVGLGAILLAVTGVKAFRPSEQPHPSPYVPSNVQLVDKMRDWPLVGAVVNRISPRPIFMMGAIAPPPPVSIAPPVQTPGTKSSQSGSSQSPTGEQK